MWPFTEKVYIKKYSDNEYAVCLWEGFPLFSTGYIGEDMHVWYYWVNKKYFILSSYSQAYDRYNEYLEYKKQGKEPKGEVVYP